MRKTTFKYKYYGHGYDAAMVYLVYEYRGHEYTVFENRAKGNPPLAWQHGSEQALIDKQIEQENKPADHETIRYEDTAEYELSLYKHLETRECPDDHQDSENKRYYLLTLICHR